MNEHTALAVTDDWLNTTGLTAGCAMTSCVPWNTTIVYPSWGYLAVRSPARPIKLTMAEIERLRTAARGDKSIKAILAKFTEQIEIVVDFE